jgi:hypothetical protein
MADGTRKTIADTPATISAEHDFLILPAPPA